MLSGSATVNLGETVLLSCAGYGIPITRISWTLNGQPLTNSSLLSIYEAGVLNSGHFVRQSFLEICSASTAHDGNYTCTVSNTLVDTFASTQLSVTGNFGKMFQARGQCLLFYRTRVYYLWSAV